MPDADEADQKEVTNMKEMVYEPRFKTELLDSGTYNGYQYRIVSKGLHPCAYVKIPEGMV